MELCEGGDLAQKIKGKKEGNVNFSVKKVCLWMQMVKFNRLL